MCACVDGDDSRSRLARSSRFLQTASHAPGRSGQEKLAAARRGRDVGCRPRGPTRRRASTHAAPLREQGFHGRALHPGGRAARPPALCRVRRSASCRSRRREYCVRKRRPREGMCQPIVQWPIGLHDKLEDRTSFQVQMNTIYGPGGPL